MRFGVGTYLWSKSEAAQLLSAGGDPDVDAAPAPAKRQQAHQGGPSQPAHVRRFWDEFHRLSPDDQQAVRDNWDADVMGASPDTMTPVQAEVAQELITHVLAAVGAQAVADPT
jgi:hypothetical protein